MNPQNQTNEIDPNSTGTEIMHDIPVKAPSNLPPGSPALPPVNTKTQMDNILKQVSGDVKKSDKQPKRPPKLKKIKPPKQLTGKQANFARLLPLIVALTFFVILSSAAVYSYSKSQKPVARTQPNKTAYSTNSANITPAVKTVTADDLAAFSTDLQNQINDLGLTQFSTDELSDASLGL